MAFYGTKPLWARFYAKDPTGRLEVIAWTPPGDGLCRALAGRSAAQPDRDVLDGRHGHVLRKEAGCHADI